MRRLKKSLALLIALTMVLSTFAITTVSAKNFGDTSGYWAETLIDKWSDNGVINGYADGMFRPDDSITRAELAKIISAAKNYTASADIAFADVSGDEWYAADLKKCVAQGIIGGYEDGTFRPDNYITREEASTMFVRAYNVNAIGMLDFADTNDISEWAKTAVTALVGAGVINGYEDGTFMPKASITRAEVVKILDGVNSISADFPQATNSTGGTNSVGTIGNLGSGSTGGGFGGGGGSQVTPSYRVTFNANGGEFSDGKETASITLGKNSVIGSRAPQPTRDGMSFEGWYTSADAANALIESKKWSLNKPITGNITLYAGWYIEGQVVVSFESNGGTAVESQTIVSGSYAAEPSVVPVRAHYTFEGWYTKNNGGTKVNFASTPVRINTRYYAKWIVDSEYADVEVTIPTETTGSYHNGTIEAIPPSVIPGETVTFNIIPPEGFEIEGVPTIKYISSSTGEEMTVSEAAIKYNKETNEYSFVMPSDVQNNSVSVNPRYVTALPTEKPLPPTPTVDPNVPTEIPVVEPTYKFSDEAFAELSELPANKEVGGLTVSKASSIDGSNKTFNGSGYKYSRRCKIGTATLSFKVNGTCQIKIDAVSASSADRVYSVFAGSTSLGTFTCLNGASDTATFNYTGGAETISIKPAAGINIYGIFVDYNAEVPTIAPVPTATPEPTVDPNHRYNISIADNIQNGSVVVNSGSVSSDAIKTVRWEAADHVPAGAVEGQTPVFGVNGAATVNLNDVDASDGTLTLYEEAHYYDWVWDKANGGDGKTYRYIRGENNPSASPPFSDSNQPGGAIFRYDAAKDGYITLEIYAYSNKHLYIYDNNAQSTIEDFTTGAEAKHTFTFSCEQSNSYYFWAVGSKIGIISATYSSNILQAKAGDTITVTTKPNAEYKTDEVTTNPATTVSAGSTANSYTFKMPASDVTVGAKFVSTTGQPDPTATPDPNTEYTVKVADGITGGTLQIVQPAAPTADPTATPKPTIPPMTAINEEYTFLSETYTNAASGTATAISAFTLLDNGKVYSEGGNNGATNKNKSIINGEQYHNSLRLKQAQNTLLIELGSASTITVYSNNDLAKDRHVILGTTAGGNDISTACIPTEEEITDGVKSVATTFNNVPAGKVYISATGDLFIAGFTVVPGGTAAASVVAAAEDTTVDTPTSDEVLVNEFKAKAGQTITVKAIANNPEDAISITTDPSVTVTDAGNGYYTFTMPAADTTVNATFGTASETPVPTTAPTTTPTDVPSDSNVTVIKATDFEFNRTGEHASRPGANSDFAFGTATAAYNDFIAIFGENAVNAGNKAVNYNGKQYGNTSFKFTPKADGSYNLYMLALKASNTANTRVTVSSNEDAKIDFTISDAIDDKGALVLTAKSTFELSANTEYAFTILPDVQADQYTGDIAAVALVMAK